MIFFDIDGTLLDHDYAERAGVLDFYRTYSHMFDMQESEFIRIWMKSTNENFERYLSKEFTFQEQRRVRLENLFVYADRTLSDDDADHLFETYLRFYRENWRAFSDVLPCLNSLKGFTLGIISNGDYEQQVEKLERMNVRDYFAYVITSSNAGVSKPDDRIFTEASRQAGRKPEECFYVGDRLDTDVFASQRAGMKGIWLDRDCKTGASEKRISVINNLDKLLPLVHSSY